MKNKATRARIGVHKGYGPTHANNAKEGEQVNTDTVPAMLTPREAVLNRNAAELAGRGNIEQLNSEGNQLAQKGVDLAAKGQASVPPAVLPKVPGPSAAAEIMKYLPVAGLRRLARGEVPKLAAEKGTMNVKPKQSKPKAKPAAPPQSGSPYVQGFQQQQMQPQGFQGGGYVPLPKPGVSTDPLGSYVPGGVTQGIDPIGKPFQGTPAQFYAARWQAGHPGQTWDGPQPGYKPLPTPGVGDTPVRGVNPAFPGRGPGGVYPGGNTDPLTPPAAQSPQQPMWSGGTPLQAVSGTTYPMGLKGMPSNSFYPQGQQQPLQAAYGASDVSGGGGDSGYLSNPEKAYGPPVQLSAPEILQHLQKAAKDQGLSQSQIGAISKQLLSVIGGGGSMAGNYAAAGSSTPVYGESGYPSAIPVGGYQGGISDIGYPPFIAPGSEYHGDRGGWLGQYDQNYMVPRYARGTSNVGSGFFR